MGRLRFGLLATALASTIGTVVFVGCAADGGDVDVPAVEPQGPDASTNTTVPAWSSDAGEPEKPDAAPPKKDGGAVKSDAGVDAGPPLPVPGEPCPKPDQIVEKQCGACGKQSAVCLVGDGGAGYWSDYGACSNETPNGCVPGQTETEACGNCGTRVRTCSKYCGWSITQCTGQPVDSCPPGSVELITAGCPAEMYRRKSCKADCTYNPVSVTCDDPPSVVDVPPTVGSVSWTVAILSPNRKMPRLTGGVCPNPTVSSTITPYVYIQVRNPLPKAATVSIWNSTAPSGVIVDTTLGAYASETGPTVDASRKDCLRLNSYGNSTLTGDSRFASLDGSQGVTIPAGGVVSVYVAADKSFDASKPTESTGPVRLNVRTESLAP